LLIENKNEKQDIHTIILTLSDYCFLHSKNKVVTSIDTTKNKIGAEFKLTVKTSVDTTSKVAFPNPKNLGALRSYRIL
jgi:hypothetical protein